MIDLSHLPFTQQMQFKEANVRGVYLSIACDMEFLMDDIIAKCEIDNQDERQEFRERKIIQLEMGKKLGRCIKSLSEYRNGIYYKKFSTQFDIIEKLVHYRNLMAHGYSEYDEKKIDKSFIVFRNIDKGKKNEEKIEIMPFLINMEEYRSNLMRLLDLTSILSAERGHK